MGLNIAILILGCTAALAAIFGNTHRPERKFPRSLNARGWMALTCAIGTLVIGTQKERLTHDRERKDAERITRLESMLESATQNLATVSRSVTGIDRSVTGIGQSVTGISQSVTHSEKVSSEQELSRIEEAEFKKKVVELITRIADTLHSRGPSVRRGYIDGSTEGYFAIMEYLRQQEPGARGDEKIKMIERFGKYQTDIEFRSYFVRRPD
jgi:hypothetical protein